MTEAKLYAIWAAVGPLVGVIIGAWLAGRSQHRQWVRDSKKAEYREVLDALGAYRWMLLDYHARVAGGVVARDPKEVHGLEKDLGEAQVRLHNALNDRLFIRRALVRRHVWEEFQSFVRKLNDVKAPEISQLIQALGGVRSKIVEAAERDLGLAEPSHSKDEP